MLKPQYNYLLCKEVKPETGAVVTPDMSDTWQKYEVLEVGSGRLNEDSAPIKIPADIKKGVIIYVQKHSEADTPKELKDKGLALIMADRVMAVGEIE